MVDTKKKELNYVIIFKKVDITYVQDSDPQYSAVNQFPRFRNEQLMPRGLGWKRGMKSFGRYSNWP